MNTAKTRMHNEIDQIAARLDHSATIVPPLANPRAKIELLKHLAQVVCSGELRMEMIDLADWVEKVLAVYGRSARNENN